LIGRTFRDADLLLVTTTSLSIGTAWKSFTRHDLGKFVIAFSPFQFRRGLQKQPWMVAPFAPRYWPEL